MFAGDGLAGLATWGWEGGVGGVCELQSPMKMAIGGGDGLCGGSRPPLGEEEKTADRT
jgi:hypothetical protein